ncbi:alpha/beta hydrolase [Candidatus Roizmanbacteria bacterium CG09_land_8_20_14_0_10_41_9]|uniref:Alpha/beta hydrolase n=1 Tax=Candidatus Roizmanbacteria bacterium CG09_land_8_20_14_0_10_41_9 TaxID=1974850 RepID=A0A2H0WSN2_9BACT|nr:MAG: alpha/beta hydrolase [Candidatus Roizmanbacteria bacterium CG09_land_8_20_14_0_10_41_9]
MNKNIPIIILVIVVGLFGILFLKKNSAKTVKPVVQLVSKNSYPLSVEYMREQSYPGSELNIEEELSDGNNYHQYIASYLSQGLKMYGLLTVPIGDKPASGWPVVIFNHGYIPPDQYVTTERYVAYVDSFARNGYVVFKPDYRGHGHSEGKPEGTYYSPAYTIDVLNAVSTLKKYKDADPKRMGMWGHSMGGNIILRAMVTTKDIKAGAIWAGVVGTYDEIMNEWRRGLPQRSTGEQATQHISSIRQNLEKTYGSLEGNPSFWHSIDPRFYLKDISGPIQLHQGTADETVPKEFSLSLRDDLLKQKKTVEYYEYEGADHNISSPSFEVAMQRSIDFFNKYVKSSSAKATEDEGR